MNDFAEIQQIADRFNLSLEELRSLLEETDEKRGVLTASDQTRGLSHILQFYIQCLGTAAERFGDPVERLVVDRLVSATIELIIGQLEAAPHQPN